MTITKVARKATLSVVDVVALIIGLVIGAGIFETPPIVVANTGSAFVALLTWLLGGGCSLIGAVCYAELATAYPHPGGNYYYFQRAFGQGVAFLFAWARMTVIQTGSIAVLAFALGDYASQLLRLGNYSSSIYAGGAIALLTGLNILGIKQSKWTQNWLAVAQVLGLLLVIVVGLTFTNLRPDTTVSTPPTTSKNLGLAMIFVLLSYGGWNEAAYISAELRDVQRNMSRTLLFSLSIITVLFLLVNLAYIHGLGIEAMASSQAVAADLMRHTIGEPGAVFISLLVVVATLCSINATIFTGARTNYALGQDFSFFAFLGHWSERRSTPTNAVLVQGGISLVLVLLGTLTPRGFETMVDYTTPVFWFFFLLTGVSLFVLRMREPSVLRPFQVPLYPLTPLLFCAFCLYMLQSSLAYTGWGASVGVFVLLAGVPLLGIARRLDKNNQRTEK
ncbi:APC family permease [Iningainema tapete]|uniref:Amino acid permease n=1 Tax=Iningainema tapete BLCC-T55 TaxID=2748662 RepID=A0A8J6XHK6_9CYAN|nr:amino acid permease [Iningainema tapete]MBD2772737.1 amino acid permease [Iningainema tapete BLCC-T55]